MTPMWAVPLAASTGKGVKTAEKGALRSFLPSVICELCISDKSVRDVQFISLSVDNWLSAL